MISFKLVSPGLDPRPVRVYVDKISIAGLKKFGAFARRGAMSSLRYRKKASAPGMPPSAHRSGRFTKMKTNKKTGLQTRTGLSPLRELIRFVVIPGPPARVLIGPIGAGSRPGDAPEALEFSGSAIVRDPVSSAGKRKASKRQATEFRRLVKAGIIVVPKTEYRDRVVAIGKRPFMGPAFRKELGNAAKIFAGKR